MIVIARIAHTYRLWINEGMEGGYSDVPGFCKSIALHELRQADYILVPGRYVDPEVDDDDGVPFEEEMTRLAAQWRKQQAEAQRLDAAIDENLRLLGFGNPEL